jgi:hypothetical protein
MSGAAVKLALNAAMLVALVLPCLQPRAQAVWVAEAPGPNTKGQVEQIADGEVTGAIRAVAPHPTDEKIVYVGAVNGGVWKTTNAMEAKPHWVPLTDNQKSLSIGALAFDPTDATHNTLVAGVGRYSSYAQNGGPRTGLLRTTDGGAHWTTDDGGGVLKGLNVSGVAPRGSAIVISVDGSDDGDPAKLGLWRWAAADNRWQRVAEDSEQKPIEGRSFGVAGDPSDPQVLYANAGSGLYRSADAGATWDRVRDPVMEPLLVGSRNVRIAVGGARNVFVAVANNKLCRGKVCPKLVGVFRSSDGSSGWERMDLPATREWGVTEGGSADIHLSLAADRSNPQVVYVGGNSQLPTPGTVFPWNPNSPPNSIPQSPNAIGATNYSGVLFRGDASKLSGQQWVHLTHSSTAGAAGGGTRSGSSPHADSRDMAFAANGVLIEADDGGVYRRTDPLTNQGDWASMNGNLQVTELHSIAYDHNYHVIIGGAQDTGTPQQRARSDVRWESISERDGDGGIVAVDTGTPDVSSRYSSSYELSNIRRQVFNRVNGTMTNEIPALVVTKGNPKLDYQFYTPIKVNAVKPGYLIVGAVNAVYESTDDGGKLTEIGRDIMVNSIGNSLPDSYGACPIAYGASGNPQVLYVGSGARVFVRKSEKSSLKQSSKYSGGYVVGVAVDPARPKTAYVIDNGHVYRTTDAGDKWNEVTGNLQALAPGGLHSITYSTSTPAGAVVVGGEAGVFAASGDKFSNWVRVGTGLPNAPVVHLEYNAVDRVLVAGTLGRSAWTLPAPPPAGPAPPAPVSVQTERSKNAKIKERKGKRSRDAKARETFTLRPGLVIDPERNRAYVMSVEGGVDAVELSGGGKLWNNKDAARPLGVAGPRLVTQTELPDAQNNMGLVVLESLTGKELVEGKKRLPENVEATVVETPNGEFLAEAQGTGENAVIVWKFLERGHRLVRQDLRDTRIQAKRAPASTLNTLPDEVEGDTDGAFELNLTTGATSTVNDPGFIKSFGLRESLTLPLFDKNPASDLPAGQLLSADGRHFLVSEVTGDDRVWDKYTVTVYESETHRRVGTFKSHFSITSFFVSDSLVIFETLPYTQTGPAGTVEEPRKLRAVDMTTGKEAWGRPVRDTTYRGPFPP